MKYILLTFLFLFEAGVAFSQNNDDSLDVYVATNFDNCSYGLKNKKGEWIVQPIYDYIDQVSYNEPFFIIEKKNLKGLVDLSGKLLLNVEFDDINILEYYFQKDNVNRFSSADMFIVRKNGKEGLYNINEKSFLLKLNYEDIRKSGPYVVFMNEQNKCGLLDSNGIVLKPKYDDLEVLDRAFLKFKENRNNTSYFGVINRKGKTILEAEYTNIKFINSLESILFFADKSIGNVNVLDIVNIKGKILHHFINPIKDYYIHYDFSLNGTCKLVTQDSTYIINYKGTVLYRSNTDNVRHINISGVHSRIAYIVHHNNSHFVYDNQGKPIFDLGYESLELLRYGCETYVSDLNVCKYGFKARRDGKYGVINSNDSVLFPFIYDDIYVSVQNIYLVHDDTLKAISLSNLQPSNFYGNALKVFSVYTNSTFFDNGQFDHENYKAGLYTNDGKIVLKPNYFINEVAGKLYFFSTEFKNGYIDANGNIFYNDKQNYANVTPLTNNRFIIENEESLLGLTDSNFNVILEPNFNGISDVIGDDMIWVKLNNDDCDTCEDDSEIYYDENKYQLYDINGRLLNDSIFYSTTNFVNNRAVVSQNGLYSVLNEKGKPLVPYVYEKIVMQDSSYFMVLKDSLWYVTDWNLHPLTPTFISITPVIDNTIIFKDTNLTIGFYRLDGYQVNNCLNYFNQNNTNIFDSIHFQSIEGYYYWNSTESDNYNIENFYSLDTIENKKIQNLLKNTFAEYTIENLLFDAGNFNYGNGYVDMNHPLQYEYGWDEEWGDYSEYVSNQVSVEYVDQSLVAYHVQSSSCYIPPRGAGHCDISYSFYNLKFVNDTLTELKLGDVLSENYYADLKKAFIKAYEELENNSTDCKNLDVLLSAESTNFIIDEDGLTIYTQNYLMDFDAIDDYEVTIPYSEIKNIIPPNSVLIKFLK